MDKRKLATVVVALFGAMIVAALLRFNTQPQSYERYLVGNVVGLLWIPMLTIFFILRDDVDSYGFGPTRSKNVWMWVLGLAVLIILAEALVARWPRYQEYYPMYRQFGLGSGNGIDIHTLVYFELTYGMYLFCWEFFFRGYLLFGFAQTVGWRAVVLQAIPFGIMHYGKPEFAVSFMGGLILGILAYRAKSFLPAFVLHWTAAISLDLLVVFVR